MATTPSHHIAVALSELEAALAILNTEIGNYPVPIAGCDVQFNTLLAERRRIESAIKALSIDGESE